MLASMYCWLENRPTCKRKNERPARAPRSGPDEAMRDADGRPKSQITNRITQTISQGSDLLSQIHPTGLMFVL